MTLIFDTETTGKADFKLVPEHILQPRLVQLGAMLFDDQWNIRASVSLIIKPNGYEIPSEVAKIHGITQEVALKYGLSERAVLALFSGLCSRATTLVAHNIKLDGIVMGRAFSVHKDLPPVQLPTPFCTMTAMTPICKLPSKFPGQQFKWPTLTEAYAHCFNKFPEKSHDALADVISCAAVYRWIQTQPK